MHETDWLPGIVALSLGLIGGVLLWLRFGKGTRPQHQRVAAEAAELGDLRARKEILLARLRELHPEIESETDSAAAAALIRERQSLELEAAEVLRSLQQAEARPARSSVASAGEAVGAAGGADLGFFAARPVLRGFLWGAGSASFLFVLAFLLLDFLPGGSAHISRPMGGPMTGGDAVMADSSRRLPGAGDDEADPELDGLRTLVAAQPTNLQAKLDLAQALIFRDLLVDAFSVVQEVAKVEPQNARALTYEAVVRQAMGMGERALELLEQAVTNEPTLTEAWVRRGLTAFELERYQLAIDSWEQALAQRPDGAPALRPVIDEARSRLAGGSPRQGATAPAAGGPIAPGAAMPPGHPPATRADPPASAGASAGAPASEGVKLTIELAPALADQIEPGSVLFVYARPAGMTSGPPTAAKRLIAGTFPIELTIGPSDTMMGQPFPEKVAIEARIDRDGDPITRDPSDPTGRVDGLSPGGVPARIVLQ